MKKCIIVTLLIAILLSCCACGKKQATTPTQAPTAEPTPDSASPEAMYGHIDQTVPQDGVYKLWNAEGVKVIAQHPEAMFELLCHVDMGGAVLSPIPEFTGTITGQNCTISNFTIQGGGADFGFISVNKGKIRNLYLDQVTFLPGADTKNIGAMAGTNVGEISRCTITGGTMTVEKTAANASCGSMAGTNTGTITNSAAAVDIAYSAAARANVGGIVGTDMGGTLDYVDTNGKLVVTGENKTVGILVGSAKDTTLNYCAFLGEANTLNDKLVNDYFGTQENVAGTNLLWRDNGRAPEDPKIQALREKCVQNMYEQCTIEWHPVQDIPHTCSDTAPICNAVYSTTYDYYFGLPYNHKNGSLARMKYCLNEDGTVKDWVYEMAAEGTFDTFDLYMGNDCSTAVQQAWATIGCNTEFMRTSLQLPGMAEFMQHEVVAVGDWEWDLDLDVLGHANTSTTSAKVSKNYTDHNGPAVMYEAYACLRMGDGVGFTYKNAGHSRMCAEDAVVVRDENGNIEPQYSYVLMHEQGKEVIDEEQNSYSTCAVYQKYTFDNLYSHYYLPFTIKELATGEIQEPTCTLEGGMEEDCRLALTTGTLKSNYSLDYVTMVITDESGKEVFHHVMFPSVTKRTDDNANDTHIRRIFKEYDLAGFAIPLKDMVFDIGGTYHATITGSLATGDNFVVKDFTFQNG